jgi:hypothetical protein
MEFVNGPFLASDPLPPSATLLLYQGERGFTVPLRKGDSREAEGAHTPCRNRFFCAKYPSDENWELGVEHGSDELTDAVR